MSKLVDIKGYLNMSDEYDFMAIIYRKVNYD